jgi:nucleotide-binding universal stress UspA family protein
MSENHEIPERRILVAIDTSPHGSAALEVAARLATELRAELQGLFVEDINLLRLAGLPFTREIDYPSGTSRPLDIEAMEQTLRTRAEGVRRAIAETARRTSLRWSFRTSRGNLAQTMLTESLEADLLLIGREESSPSTSRAIAHQGPIMVIDEGSCSSNRLMDTAQRLARQHADIIVALVTRDDRETTDKHADEPPSFYVQRCSSNVEALLQAAKRWRPQILLIDRSSPFASESSINSLVTQLACPLALVQ